MYNRIHVVKQIRQIFPKWQHQIIAHEKKKHKLCFTLWGWERQQIFRRDLHKASEELEEQMRPFSRFQFSHTQCNLVLLGLLVYIFVESLSDALFPRYGIVLRANYLAPKKKKYTRNCPPLQ